MQGYSVVRSLSEAPKYASVIANILKKSSIRGMLSSNENISMQGLVQSSLWLQRWFDFDMQFRSSLIYPLVENYSLEYSLATRKETAKIILSFRTGTYSGTGY